MSLLLFLHQDQRMLPWILVSWKPALSFPSTLDHRAAGWLGRKDPSPSQHPLGISSPGPLCHQRAICIHFTFGSLLLTAIIESWLEPSVLSSSSQRLWHCGYLKKHSQGSQTWCMHSAVLFLVTLFVFFSEEPNSGLRLRHPAMDTLHHPHTRDPNCLF